MEELDYQHTKERALRYYTSSLVLLTIPKQTGLLSVSRMRYNTVIRSVMYRA